MIFHGPRDPVYTISVAARLLGVSASFLRQVEGEGLVCPARTGSNIRLYSDEDLKLLSKIVYLCRSRGVNLQGVRVILAMEEGESGYPIVSRPSSSIALGPGEHEGIDPKRVNPRSQGSGPGNGRPRDGGFVTNN